MGWGSLELIWVLVKGYNGFNVRVWGFRVQGLGFRLQGLGFGVLVKGFHLGYHNRDL